MKTIAILYKTILLFLLTISFAFSCSDNETKDVAPEIASITPLIGPKSTPLVIRGKNFGTSLMDNDVTINGKSATITEASATQLTVLVPPAADSGPVVVTTNGRPAINQPAFTFQWTVSTFAGSSQGYVDGSAAKFYSPSGVVTDAQGNLYVTDYNNHLIRKITPEGVTTTHAGSTLGYLNGSGTAAQFGYPNGAAIDNQGNVYVCDEITHRIRKITPSREVSLLAGNGIPNGPYDGEGSQATFNTPSGIAADAKGNLYIADQFNHRIRKVTPSGMVSTVAGSTQGFADGSRSSAKFNRPAGVVVDNTGNVYVGDLFNHRIRKITEAGDVSTIAGSSYGFSNGMGTTAQFAYPAGLALDKNGNLYVADTENQRIRKITPEGVVSTFAGTTQGTSDGLATVAQFYGPREIEIDNAGNIYVVETGNNRIRKID